MSIDWDYFLGGDITKKWEYTAKPDWSSRQRPADGMYDITRNQIDKFVNQLGTLTPTRLIKTQNHVDILGVVNQESTYNIINFDAHHDAGYIPDHSVGFSNGNWVEHLKRCRILQKYTLIYPEWRRGQPEIKPLAYIDKIRYEYRKQINPDWICLFYSPQWSPPWNDDSYQYLQDLIITNQTGLEWEDGQI